MGLIESMRTNCEMKILESNSSEFWKIFIIFRSGCALKTEGAMFSS